MSLRTISQLPLLDFSEITSNHTAIENFKDSHMEISHVDQSTETEGHYKSKRLFMGDFSNYIFWEILSGGEDGITEFDCSVIFEQPVYFKTDLTLSGDLWVNKDLTDDEASQYSIYLKSGDNTIYGVDKNNFYAPETNLCTDHLYLYTTEGDLYGDINSEDTYLTTNVNIIGDGSYLGDLEVGGDIHSEGDISADGDIHGTLFYGVALSARWADLAETYKSDNEYEKGTLVKFGGPEEITIADTEVNAVITTRPGLILNGDQKGCQIALTGRTPVKVIGKVKKFDNIYLCPFNKGIGATKDYILAKNSEIILDNPIGKALISNDLDEIKLVECVVQMRF